MFGRCARFLGPGPRSRSYERVDRLAAQPGRGLADNSPLLRPDREPGDDMQQVLDRVGNAQGGRGDHRLHQRSNLVPDGSRIARSIRVDDRRRPHIEGRGPRIPAGQAATQVAYDLNNKERGSMVGGSARSRAPGTGPRSSSLARRGHRRCRRSSRPGHRPPPRRCPGRARAEPPRCRRFSSSDAINPPPRHDVDYRQLAAHHELLTNISPHTVGDDHETGQADPAHPGRWQRSPVQRATTSAAPSKPLIRGTQEQPCPGPAAG